MAESITSIDLAECPLLLDNRRSDVCVSASAAHCLNENKNGFRKKECDIRMKD